MDAERDALVALYRATNGDSWTEKQGWCTDAPLSEWHGVTVNEGRVVDLRLFANNLQGPIPKELGQLGALTILWLLANKLEGSIPKELGQLGALAFLNLAYNKLEGSIPKELEQLRALRELDLSNNKLEGEREASGINHFEVETSQIYISCIELLLHQRGCITKRFPLGHLHTQ
ncbi:unnamed protein product [Ascophyllum nodosum]